MFKKSYITVGLILIIFPLLNHLLYSWIGYNPSDDGFFLSLSRRLLEGQIPHKDFIEVRPLGTPILHIPEIIFGGNYTYWTSRLVVWFEFTIISLSWIFIFQSFLKITFNRFEIIFLTIISFIFNVHNFPIMVWGTIDGMLFVSIGILILSHKSYKMRHLGYIILGFSYLCKQSFLPIVLLTPLFFKDWKYIRSWFFIFIPAVVYFFFLLIGGAIPDAIIQLKSRQDIISNASSSFLFSWPVPWGIIFGYAFNLIYNIETEKNNKKYFKYFAISAIYLLITVGLYTLALGKYKNTYPYFVYGTTAGIFLFFSFQYFKNKDIALLSLLLLIFGWCVSLSQGYNTPALSTGLMLLLVIFILKGLLINQKVYYYIIIFLTIFSLLGFWNIRNKFVYNEKPSRELNYSLDGVFPGANSIYTNVHTYKFLAELKIIIDENKGKQVVILPEVAGYWVKSPTLNILPVDWPNTELGGVFNIKLFERLKESLEINRGKTKIILQKVQARTLSETLMPIDTTEYIIVPYIKNNFKKTDEKQYFEIYE